MASTGSLFSQTLQDITTTKLLELAKKRKTFEEQRLKLVETVEDGQNAIQSLVDLADGVKSCFGASEVRGRVVRGSTNNPRLEIDLNNLNRFLKQARYDPAITHKALDRWHQSLSRHLDIQSLKFSFATLYGHLTTEWLQTKNAAPITPVTDDVDMEEFEHVSNVKKMESRLNWERSVFEPAKINSDEVRKMLNEIFDTSSDERKELVKALKTLRESLRDFETTLASPGNFNQDTLSWAIRSLQTSDLLTDEKRGVLKDFLASPVIINEIADVLNMRMSALSTWSWGEEVLLEQRRQLSGSYNIFMHEDLLQAIFLQYIGIKWSVFWKRAFSNLRKTKGVWKSSRTTIPPLDRKRRDYYLGPASENPSLQSKKRKLYRRSYFLSQLLGSEYQQIENEEGEVEADFNNFQSTPSPASPAYSPQAALCFQPPARSTQTARQAFASQPPPRRQLASKAARRTAFVDEDRNSEPEDEDEDEDEDGTKNPMQAKQNLLHLLSTDILIQTRLHGEITCFRSQFEHFYPTLPHTTIKTILEFFGVSQLWLRFFERFLQPPLRFSDDEDAAPRLRKRGTPGSHVISEVFGEVVLFCLDYNINQIGEGESLWRLHDDFWFWSSKQERCVKTWTAITSFSKTMGLSLHDGRTGSARMLLQKKGQGDARSIVAADVKRPLPQGQIRWGMLYLNSESGRFEIDQKMVDRHIEELVRQLKDKSGSVMAWIQAWNTYATTFFTSNFGTPANCFGREHVDNMLATHERIQRSIFSAMEDDRDGISPSVIGYLKKIILQRFEVKDIPDGYFFLPVELGGLEVQSPFVGLLQIRDAVTASPSKMLDDFEEAEKKAYKNAKIHYETYGSQQPQYYHSQQDANFKPKDPDVFMPFDEYIRYREELNYGFSQELVQVFEKLLERPGQESIETDDNGTVKIALNALSMQPGLRGILCNWYTMEPYWKWVAQLYGPEIIERFGGFNIVDPGLLPIGMVSLFRSGRVKWQE